jgi:hypothetical protein
MDEHSSPFFSINLVIGLSALQGFKVLFYLSILKRSRHASLSASSYFYGTKQLKIKFKTAKIFNGNSYVFYFLHCLMFI